MDNNIGCELLREQIVTKKPKVHCFGHVHSEYGIDCIENTIAINAASVDINNKLTHEPIVLKFTKNNNHRFNIDVLNHNAIDDISNVSKK